MGACRIDSLNSRLPDLCIGVVRVSGSSVQMEVLMKKGELPQEGFVRLNQVLVIPVSWSTWFRGIQS
ncbi:MAG: hypothetical protein ACJAQT_000049 [Akkermansiaceae bacterium]|jgi:hypothetical protein